MEKKIKLTDAQKKSLQDWQRHPDQMCMRLIDGFWLTGGVGVKIPTNTYHALRKKGLIGANDYLTELGKTFQI